MVRDQYADKIMELIELDAPVADTRTEIKAHLKQYFIDQMAVYGSEAALHQIQLEDVIDQIEQGGI